MPRNIEPNFVFGELTWNFPGTGDPRNPQTIKEDDEKLPF